MVATVFKGTKFKGFNPIMHLDPINPLVSTTNKKCHMANPNPHPPHGDHESMGFALFSRVFCRICASLSHEICTIPRAGTGKVVIENR